MSAADRSVGTPRTPTASPLHPSEVPTMPSNEVSLLLVDDDPSAIQVLSRMLAGDPNQRFSTSEPVLGSCFTVLPPRTPDAAARPADRAPARQA